MFKLDQASEKSILNMLLDNKLINKEQINRISTVSSEGGKSKIETALELEFTTENKILEVLSKSYSLPIVELKNYSLDEKLKDIIPINYVKENFMVPFEISGNTLKIAISDASKLSLMKNIKTITQMNPELYAASISDTNNFINGITKSENKNNIKKASTTEKKIKKENYDEIEDDSEVVKVLVAKPFNISVKTSSSKVILTVEFFWFIVAPEIWYVLLSIVNVKLSVPE